MHIGEKHIGEQMTVFDRTQEHPLATVDLQNYLTSVAFSADQKFLYLLGESRDQEGKTLHDGGTLDVVDVETGKVLHAYTVGKDPLRLLALGRRQGMCVEEKGEVQFIFEEGVLRPGRIVLNGDASSGSPKLEGYPGEVLLLSGSKAAILITKKNGAPAHRLALVDLEGQKAVRVVHVGRKSVRAGKMVGRIGLAVGLSAASYGAFSSAGSPYYLTFIPGLGLSGSRGLARGDDGEDFYALDAASNDVTVVKSADGAVAGHIPVDSSSFRLWTPKGGQYLFCLGRKEISVIGTDSGKHPAKYKLDGDMVDEEIDRGASRFYLLTDKELEVWDGKNAKRITAIPGLKRALLIARGEGFRP